MDVFPLPFAFKSALQRFTRDLTAAALRQELEAVCCRDQEIQRVITVLVRQSKNNPVLIGEAGVGKTAVVEGLAQRMAEGQVPDKLKTARILSLSHIDLIAGTSFRGQYERRIQAVVREASADPDVILFIDELHNLIGAGVALGAPMDAANLLKPALASGQLRAIGATTDDEYDHYIRADSALERRFQPVRIRELNRNETLEVLKSRRPNLEMHHLLAISDEALEGATDSSMQYSSDRKQPDRSIDLLDETCALLRLNNKHSPSKQIQMLQQKRESLLAAERALVSDILKIENAKGTPLERFSRGTFRAFESMGSRLEEFLTGQRTPRPPLPLPESVLRISEKNPTRRLAKIHYERLKAEARLHKELHRGGVTVTSADIANIIKS